MEEVNERKWCVYMHINKINQKVYIGLTSKDVKDRWGSAGSGYGEQQPVFKRAIDKYGWDGFEHVIIEDSLTYKEASEMEVSLIALYKSNCRRYNNPSYGYNMTDGGEGTSGRICTEETKNKISQKAKERLANPQNHPWFGKTHSDETKEKWSRIRKGRPAKNKGIPLSDETKKKLSEAHKGKYEGKSNPNYGKGKSVIQLDKTGMIVAEYSTVTEASRITDIKADLIYACCRGKTKTAVGYQWVYKEKYNSDQTYAFINTHIKPVVQLDKNNVLIAEYKSISEAEMCTSIDNRAISAVCKNKRKTTGGYRWMYKEDYNKLVQQNDSKEISDDKDEI